MATDIAFANRLTGVYRAGKTRGYSPTRNFSRANGIKCRHEHTDDRKIQRLGRVTSQVIWPSPRRSRCIWLTCRSCARHWHHDRNVWACIFVALGLVGALGAVAIYGVGAFMVVSGGITIGTLVAMAAFVQRIYQPLTGLTNARLEILTALVSFERVFEVLDAPVSIADRMGAVDVINARGAVEFDHVWFRYPPSASVSIASLELAGVIQGADPDVDVLRDISLNINAGETVALVGASGTGKTTLAMLLARLYDVTSGSVRLDGHDVRDLTGISLRAAIGVVSQDSHMFHESVKSNLLYAQPNASHEQIVDACRAAKIHDVISALPDGYETIVGERGYRLSGGEKQRLAIARLLLKNPAVMILDEATSHLDNEGEILVQQALTEAMKNRTAIVIAHRLSTIRDADRIIVLSNGNIAEQGTHDQLMTANSIYASQVRAGESFDSADTK